MDQDAKIANTDAYLLLFPIEPLTQHGQYGYVSVCWGQIKHGVGIGMVSMGTLVSAEAW